MKLIFQVLHINEYFRLDEPAPAMTAVDTRKCLKSRNISLASVTNIPAQMLSFDEKDLGGHVELGDEFELTITKVNNKETLWKIE